MNAILNVYNEYIKMFKYPLLQNLSQAVNLIINFLSFNYFITTKKSGNKITKHHIITMSKVSINKTIDKCLSQENV